MMGGGHHRLISCPPGVVAQLEASIHLSMLTFGIQLTVSAFGAPGFGHVKAATTGSSLQVTVLKSVVAY